MSMIRCCCRRIGRVSVALGLAVTSAVALAAGVGVKFDLSSPATSPFPSDRFTRIDFSQNTFRRVRLPNGPVEEVVHRSHRRVAAGAGREDAWPELPAGRAFAAFGMETVRDHERVDRADIERLERGRDATGRTTSGPHGVEELVEEAGLGLALDLALDLERYVEHLALAGEHLTRDHGSQPQRERARQETPELARRLLGPRHDEPIEAATAQQIAQVLDDTLEVPVHVGVVVALVARLRDPALIVLPYREVLLETLALLDLAEEDGEEARPFLVDEDDGVTLMLVEESPQGSDVRLGLERQVILDADVQLLCFPECPRCARERVPGRRRALRSRR